MKKDQKKILNANSNRRAAQWCLQNRSKTMNLLFGLSLKHSLVQKERDWKAVTCRKKTRKNMAGSLLRSRQN